MTYVDKRVEHTTFNFLAYFQHSKNVPLYKIVDIIVTLFDINRSPTGLSLICCFIVCEFYNSKLIINNSASLAPPETMFP